MHQKYGYLMMMKRNLNEYGKNGKPMELQL